MWKLKVSDGGGPYGEYLFTTSSHIGRQTWEYDPDAGTPEERAEVEKARLKFYNNRFEIKPSGDELLRLQMLKENEGKFDLTIPPVKLGDDEDVTYDAVTTTLRRGVRLYSSLQTSDGHWAADCSGPLFHMPTMVFCLYLTQMLDTIFTAEHTKEALRYIYYHQNEDGGWGFHIEAHSSMFCTTVNYVCMRLLGQGPNGGEDNACARSRKWIRDHGGLTSVPSWGKIWFSILGIYEWSGCNPMPPEIWLLPSFLMMHPGRLWCYTRLIYLPMSYLYGKRFVGPITELILSIRKELHTQPYNKIKWFKYRHTCAKEDLYYPHPLIQNLIWDSLSVCTEPLLTRWPANKIREKALKATMKYIHYEDENSNYIEIACAEKVLCMLACWVENPESDAFKKHLPRVQDFLWMAEDGLRVSNVGGSQTWDMGFGVQALIASGLHDEVKDTLKKAHDFLKQSQVKDNPSYDFKCMHRHISKGSWAFSIPDQGWQVSDCTAEGITGCLLLSQMSPDQFGQTMEPERLYDAVNVILSLQSKNGGMSAWEPATGFDWLEVLNPTEFLEDIVVEKQYVECTAASIHSLVLFKKLYPWHRETEIEVFITKAIHYLVYDQMPDGSWYGFWGICFIYGTFHAIRGLAAVGKNCQNSPAVRKACDFFLSKQLASGGWGESYRSCSEKVYVPLQNNKTNLVQTSWALLGLIWGGQIDRDLTPLHRAVRVLINNQMENGDFPQQEISGASLKTCMLHYATYRNIFPLWALGEYRTKVFSPSQKLYQ